ncbi:unnamed protein product [Sphenostylis stenocarpa]|uniref:Purine permease 4 n=1 Tax=Sphenostylis stenocarpa TaxID=92480 RepID=A0AA86W0X8_9FABA|nr:unnamed protein product [Sphenostylis stenocarpa]
MAASSQSTSLHHQFLNTTTVQNGTNDIETVYTEEALPNLTSFMENKDENEEDQKSTANRSSIILALDSSHEKPEGLTSRNYFIGFSCTIGAGLLFSLYLPVMEKIYKRVYCYQMVMEMQLIMEIAATALATVGMAWDGGFSDMKEEAERVFDKGTTAYWVTVISTVVTWQCCFMGTAGMVFLTSSLTGGICSTALLSINVLGGVLVYKDAFGGFKAVSTVLCIWGFCSYVYGMYIKLKKNKSENERRSTSSGSSTELIPRRNPDETI